uniref:Mitochondrial fission 1 protein n=1 Tax=Trypanosoma congolense (strain IL3000) TaxID=1068625 RepID=G0UX54_TRYCI|nr:conserved hypothetical protein [Trypanosoma congolense IL3000]
MLIGNNKELLDELFKKDACVRRILSPSWDELCGLEDSIRRLAQEHSQDPNNTHLAFEYATVLISHSRNSYVEEGLRLMELLAFTAWQQRWGHGTHTQIQGACDKKVWQSDMDTAAPSSYESAQNEQQEELPVERGTTTTAATNEGNENSNASPKESSDDDFSVYYYYLTVGWLKLRRYDEALSCVNRMLQICPGHRQGVALKQYIEASSLQTFTLAGVACVTAAVVASTVIGAFLRKS